MKIILSLACYAGLLFLETMPAFCQSCTGYVLYKQDFGGNASSPDIGPPLPDSVTSYIYTNGTIQDGYYSIRKTVPNTFPHWLSGTDHTGNGYMMVINASYDPGLFYQTRIDGLCQGSSFYFSAWIANLLRASSSDPLDPNIRFVIRSVDDSSVIAEYTTGTLPRYSTLTWTQYGINFKLPAGQSSVLLQMYNHQTGGNGNDLVMDDITFSLCGPAMQITSTGTYQHSQDVCNGDPVSFHANIDTGFYRDPVYQWQFSEDTINWKNMDGAVTTTLNIPHTTSADSGWYRLLVAEDGNINSPYCRIASPSIPLRVWSPQTLAITSNSPVCEGTSLQINAPGAIGYQWTGPAGFTGDSAAVLIPHVNIDQQGMYILTGTTEGGCVSNAQTMVTVQPDDLRVSFEGDSILCQGSTINLNVANPGASYQWNTGEQSSMINVDTAGFYKVVVTKGACQKSDSVMLREVLKPAVDLGNDTTICLGEPYSLNATFKDAENYLWQDGSPYPVYQVTGPGIYSVTVSNQCGIATGVIHIRTEECADHLIFPTAFSPNGDGMNDFFRPKVFIRVSHYEMKIFDRWGSLVFQSNDPNIGWDGTHNGNGAPVGTYIWMAHYIRVRDNKPISQKGTITLIR